MAHVRMVLKALLMKQEYICHARILDYLHVVC